MAMDAAVEFLWWWVVVVGGVVCKVIFMPNPTTVLRLCCVGPSLKRAKSKSEMVSYFFWLHLTILRGGERFRALSSREVLVLAPFDIDSPLFNSKKIVPFICTRSQNINQNVPGRQTKPVYFATFWPISRDHEP